MSAGSGELPAVPVPQGRGERRHPFQIAENVSMKSNSIVNEAMQKAIKPTKAAARKQLRRSLQVARSSLHNGKERVTTTTRHVVGNTDGYVHSSPWSAIGIAAAAGAAIAVFLSARLHR